MTFSDMYQYLVIPILAVEFYFLYKPKDKWFSRINLWLLSDRNKDKMEHLKVGEFWVAKEILQPIVKDCMDKGNDRPETDPGCRGAAQILTHQITALDVKHGIVHTVCTMGNTPKAYSIYSWIHLFTPNKRLVVETLNA